MTTSVVYLELSIFGDNYSEYAAKGGILLKISSLLGGSNILDIPLMSKFYLRVEYTPSHQYLWIDLVKREKDFLVDTICNTREYFDHELTHNSNVLEVKSYGFKVLTKYLRENML